MEDKVELRRRRIINIFYIAILLGLSYLFLKYCFWIFFPFLFAFFIAVIVQKPANFMKEKFKIKKGFSTTFLVLFIFIFVGALISLLGMRLVDAGKSLIDFIRSKLYDMPTLIENVRAWVVQTLGILPDSVEARAIASVNSWFEIISDKSASEIAALIVDSASDSGTKFSISSLSTPLSGVWDTAKQIPSVFVATLITIISSCFMAADYDWISRFIKNQFPNKTENKLSKSKHIVFESIGKLIRSYVLIIGITFSELFIGISILSLVGLYDGGHVLAIALIIALLDILPVLGTGTFMVPWIIYSLITGHVGLGIGLLVVYAVISVVRQIIEPKIVGGTVGLPSFATLMAMYIGSQLFGVIGIFLLPILVIIIKLLNDEGIIHFWHPMEDTEEKEEEKPKFQFKKLFKK